MLEKVRFNIKKKLVYYLIFLLSSSLLVRNSLGLLVCAWKFFFQEVVAKLFLRKNFTSYHLISVFMELRYVGVECWSFITVLPFINITLQNINDIKHKTAQKQDIKSNIKHFSEIGILGRPPTVLLKKVKKRKERKKKKKEGEGRKIEVEQSKSQKMPNLWLLPQP